MFEFNGFIFCLKSESITNTLGNYMDFLPRKSIINFIINLVLRMGESFIFI